eukprot:TRINITY_DN23939_c0_g2_i1.p2 TRINITY_DN23939_c0_g2~~TRINITY_DN23939_c0_g2_i1.p2  ORF type:complete len:135 (+),score=7.44 TRINITY_DN23939_c0_g2_i1:456-860(+)
MQANRHSPIRAGAEAGAANCAIGRDKKPSQTSHLKGLALYTEDTRIQQHKLKAIVHQRIKAKSRRCTRDRLDDKTRDDRPDRRSSHRRRLVCGVPSLVAAPSSSGTALSCHHAFPHRLQTNTTISAWGVLARAC